MPGNFTRGSDLQIAETGKLTILPDVIVIHLDHEYCE